MSLESPETQKPVYDKEAMRHQSYENRRVVLKEPMDLVPSGVIANLPIITTESDWLDMREGDKGYFWGRLNGTLQAGNYVVGIEVPSWGLHVATIIGGYEGQERSPGEQIIVIVKRDEDGLRTTTGDIYFNEDGL